MSGFYFFFLFYCIFIMRSLHAIKCFVCLPNPPSRTCEKLTMDYVKDCGGNETECYALVSGRTSSMVERNCGSAPSFGKPMGDGCRVIGKLGAKICSCSSDLCNDVSDRENAERIRYKEKTKNSSIKQAQATVIKEEPNSAHSRYSSLVMIIFLCVFHFQR